MLVSSSSTLTPPGLGSVSGALRLPPTFTDTFTSRYIDSGGLRQHVVIGGEGPPLLLVHGWPENWYAWRLLMPALARDYTVIAADQRGIGLSEKTQGGYDAGTLADDLAALMTKLGYQRFAVVGHDTGYIIGYALAADHRDRVDRLAVAEIPGLSEPDPLQPAPEGRSLRRVGATADVSRGDTRDVPVAALTNEHKRRKRWSSRRPRRLNP